MSWPSGTHPVITTRVLTIRVLMLVHAQGNADDYSKAIVAAQEAFKIWAAVRFDLSRYQQ